MSRIAIIGAGMAGLAAARTLRQQCKEVIVYEKSRGLGGRCATRRVDSYIFDTGATQIAPRDHALQKVMQTELDQTELVPILEPVWVIENRKARPGDASRMKLERFAYRYGITQLAKLLAENLDIRLNTTIEAIGGEGPYSIGNETFDAVLVTAPMPQAMALHPQLALRSAAQAVTYRASLSALMGYAVPLPRQSYSALVEPDQVSPVIWISLEHQKAPERAPAGHTAFTVQFSPQFSRDQYQASDAEIMDEAAGMLASLFGTEFRTPNVYQIKRWRYAQPERITTFEAANPLGTTLLLCNDAVTGPRIEQAYDAGIAAANRILETLKS